MDDVSRMFAGLQILLDNGGGPLPYVVTGVYPSKGIYELGYVTVCAASADGTVFHLAGDSNTVYSGSVVGQDSFAITQI
jgi:hypothetical protein